MLKDLGGVYASFEIEESDIVLAVNGLRVLAKGFNVTIPYKESIMRLLDRTESDALNIGAVNVVKVCNKKLIGYNTDYMAIESLLKGVKVKTAAIIGAGGAARAAAYALFRLGAREFFVFNRSRQRLLEFINYINGLGASAEALKPDARADVFLNATPMGMYYDDSQLIELFKAGSYDMVVDLAYSPNGTRLSRMASKAVDGLSVLVEQAALSIKIWTGVDVDRKKMKEAAANALS